MHLLHGKLGCMLLSKPFALPPHIIFVALILSILLFHLIVLTHLHIGWKMQVLSILNLLNNTLQPISDTLDRIRPKSNLNSG